MLNFFKGSNQAPSSRPAKTGRRSPPRRDPYLPLPLPEVVEGNEETDWALWEESVWAQDSQTESRGGSSRCDAADAFRSVGKNAP
jgi:hypothetical protein